jgi:putative transposase
VARRRKGSDRRTKAIRVLAKAQQHIANQRKDFHHKTALGLVRRFGLIAHEDLNLRGIARSSLAKSTHDAGWAGFLAILAHKAAEAGVTVVAVNPRNTTQACSGCGTLPPVRLTLADRVHTCSCGLTLDRDENAARNIRALGLSVQALPWPTGASGA